MKIKFNWFFFLFTIGIPLFAYPLGIILFWPLIFNPYQLLGPFWGLVVGGALGEAFLLFIVSYMAMPWLMVIKGDRIVFHRLFRRKLVVDLREVERAELHGNIEAGNRKGYHISFIRKDNEDRIIAMGLSYGMTMVVLEYLKDKGIDVTPYTGGITKEEWRQHVRRGY